jgi:uncharacterized repeat protein (TIGR01451 family)
MGNVWGWLALALIVVGPALAAGPQIHEGWYGLNANFTVAGLLVKTGGIAWQGRVLVDVNGTTTGLYLDDCSTIKDVIFCLDDVEGEGANISYHIVVNAPAAVLSVGKSVSNTEIPLGGEMEFTLNMENTGNQKMSDIVYRDEFPEQFAVIRVIGCDLDGNAVTWKGELLAGHKFSCTYRVQGVSPGSFRSVGLVSYHDGVSRKEEKTNEMTLEVKGFEVELSANLSEAVIGKPVTVAFLTKNTVSSELEVKVSVRPPAGVEIVEGALDWTESFEKKGTKSHNVTVRALKSGDQVFKLSARYQYQSFTRDVSAEVILPVAKPAVRLESSAKFKASPGETGMVEWSLLNGVDKAITDVHAEVAGDLASGVFDVAKIDAGEQKVIFSRQYTAPDEPGKYPVSIKVSYRNDLGEKFALEDTVTIVVGAVGVVELEIPEKEEEIPEEQVVEPVEEAPVEGNESMEPVEAKPGFVARVFAWFLSWFRKG